MGVETVRSVEHIWSDLLLVLFVPLLGTAIWWFLSRGLSRRLRTSDNEAVKGWTASGLKIVLICTYAISAGLLLYAYFVPHISYR
jgi:peptidoglycan biosynthesis protein MviN/MurJ (putative lipid II flippase)